MCEPLWNPDLGAEIRRLGFREVVELPPWGEYRRGETVITRVPANLAHGFTEQAAFLVESPAFVLFDGVDSMEDPAVHSFLGRNYDIDVAFLPVTGRSFLQGTKWEYRHTMNVENAAKVASWLDARCVVPLKDDLDSEDRREEFRERLAVCRLLEPEDTWTPEASCSD